MITEEEKKDIVNLLENVIKFLDNYEIEKVKLWSDHIIHSASIYQDEFSIAIAVLVYSIAKLLTREKLFVGKEFKEVISKIKDGLRKIKEYFEKEDYSNARIAINQLLDLIKEKDEKYKQYVMYVIKKAKIKKANKIYEHGPSLGVVASLLNVSKWELLNYIGKTSYHEKIKVTRSIFERVKDIESELE